MRADEPDPERERWRITSEHVAAAPPAPPPAPPAATAAARARKRPRDDDAAAPKAAAARASSSAKPTRISKPPPAVAPAAAAVAAAAATTSPAAAAAASAPGAKPRAPKRDEKYEYVELCDVIAGAPALAGGSGAYARGRHNAWGVVVGFSLEKPTKGAEWMTNVKLLARPPLKGVGDVLRCHRVNVNHYNGLSLIHI